MSRFRISLNLPNRLTLGRLGLCAVFVAALSVSFPFSHVVALAVFIVASLTDWLDGYIARKRNLVTDLGKLLDPLADKILISAAFVGLIGDAYGAPMWIVVVIIAREFLITGLRIVAANRGYILAAERAGKHKTISQIAFVIASLLLGAADELNLPASAFLNLVDDWIQPCLMWVALIITVGSGAIYFYKNRGLFAYEEEPSVPAPAPVPAPFPEPGLPPVLRPAFKEWEAVVAALGAGSQIVILRKGGIAEGKSGFEVKNKRFWLLPTRFHQQADKLKEGAPAVSSVPEDAPAKIGFWAEVTQVGYLQTWEEVAKLAPFHVWKEETLRERFDYKEPGLHCILVRVQRLREPVTLPWSKDFEGCKSWVDLPLDWAALSSEPVLADSAYSEIRDRITAVIRSAA